MPPGAGGGIGGKGGARLVFRLGGGAFFLAIYFPFAAFFPLAVVLDPRIKPMRFKVPNTA